MKIAQDQRHMQGRYDTSDGSISGFQFRYDNDMIFTKYHNIDIDIVLDISICSDMK